jgi:hypothetical protein
MSPLIRLPAHTHLPLPLPCHGAQRRTFLIRFAAMTGLSLAGCSSTNLGRQPGSVPDPRPLVASCRTLGSGDAELDELRQVAAAPIGELIEHRLIFLVRISEDYRGDVALWRGVERLCDAVLGGEPIPDRRLFARFLAQVIERADQPFASDLRPRITELRSLS